MTDRYLFDLADGWAVGSDDLQWIVLRRRNMRTQSGWKPVAFVATKKSVLLRVLLELGISPTPAAQAKLEAMPEGFQEWINADTEMKEAA